MTARYTIRDYKGDHSGEWRAFDEMLRKSDGRLAVRYNQRHRYSDETRTRAEAKVLAQAMADRLNALAAVSESSLPEPQMSALARYAAAYNRWAISFQGARLCPPFTHFEQTAFPAKADKYDLAADTASYAHGKYTAVADSLRLDAEHFWSQIGVWWRPLRDVALIDRDFAGEGRHWFYPSAEELTVRAYNGDVKESLPEGSVALRLVPDLLPGKVASVFVYLGEDDFDLLGWNPIGPRFDQHGAPGWITHMRPRGFDGPTPYTTMAMLGEFVKHVTDVQALIRKKRGEAT